MTTPTATRPTAGQSAQYVESSQPGLFYQVTPTSCTCPDFQFRSGSNPGHVCKHMAACGYPVRFPCGNCGEKCCDQPQMYCIGCLATLEAESERLAASRIQSRAASQEVVRSPEYRAAMAELIAGTDIWA